ncbi:putative retrotransposon hot spot protein (RHS,) [Trypanosoma cruzi]|uniref:Putative retrotransposon hot spot protein (RHS,) n=1 Tax=Trypanosoma cruzi TaxID=5693 RepID=A0A2V2UKZ9_TRYCR|nr:putative retrotransposon hot spot protein (RHS,) [Trypanosoma cruzi]
MGQNDTKSEQNKIKKKRTVVWRCCGSLHVALLRRRWALTVLQTGVAVRLHGALTVPLCKRHAQRHWESGTKQPRLSFGAGGTCWPQLGGASGMLHRTGVVMAPRRGCCDGSDAAARNAAGSKQRPQWTMSSTNMRLSDFLTMELDGRDALDANRDVLPEEFLKDPTKYICDAGVLKEIQASDRYKRMERAARDEMDMEET